MALIDVREIWNGRTGSRDMANVREYRRTFRIITNNMQDGPILVSAATIVGIPTLFSSYSDTEGNVDLFSLLQKFDVVQTEDPFVWLVNCDYSTSLARYEAPVPREASGRSGKAEHASQGQETEDPLKQPPVIHFTVQKFQRELEYTEAAVAGHVGAGKPIINSANDPFDPPVVADYTRLVATYDRNEGTLDFTRLCGFQDMLNSDTFWGQDPYTWKLNVTAQSAFTKAKFYWRVTYTLEFRNDASTTIGWLSVLIDKGLRQLSQANKPQVILDAQGHVITSPVPLDGHGHVLAAGGTPVFSDLFSKYSIGAFAGLQLIQPH